MDAFYFPKDYALSRQSFRNITQELNAEVGSWKIPSKNDDDLFVDHAYWRATKIPKFLLVLTSGIHGSETYAGSAILKMFLTEIFPKTDRENTGLFLVHAMNPYGFKHHRRTTEAGVNLNRNFSVSGELFKSKNPISKAMHDKFITRGPVTSKVSRLLEFLKEEGDDIRFGDVTLDQLTKAIAPGQFESEKNLEFGGKELEPQTKLLIEKMRELMADYQEIVGLDLHTGLGDRNRLHLLTSGSKKELHPELFAKLFKQKEDTDVYEHTPPAAEGFYDVKGALNTMFSDLAQESQRICAITMEFGTLGHSIEAQLQGWNTSMLSAQGHQYGFATKELESEILQDDFERSYPQNDEWRADVVKAARGLLQRILMRTGAL